MADSEATTSQVSEHNPINPPQPKMIRLDELEKTVLGLVKKIFVQASQTGDRGVPSTSSDVQSTLGQ